MASEVVINPAQLSTTLKKILDEYGEDVLDYVDEAIVKTAMEAQKEVKKTSPKKSGRYAKGWSVDKKETSEGPYETIYNKNTYQLTHLLEFGHVLKVGGRVAGTVSAKPHIAPIQDKTPDIFEKKLKEVMK